MNPSPVGPAVDRINPPIPIVKRWWRAAGPIGVAAVWSAAAHAGDLRAGAAVVSITPPAGLPLSGYYSERGSTGTEDELFSHALVMEKDGVRAAVVTLDLISTTRTMVEAARQEIERSAGVPGANVLITASHAHTGPVLAHRGARDDAFSTAFGGTREAVVAYSESLPGLIATSVREAVARLVPVRVEAAEGNLRGLSYNRRFFMRDGSVGWNPGKKNPEIIRPAGPIDPEVGLVVFSAAAPGPAKPVAACVNFAMHPDTTGGTKYSADYMGAMARRLADWRGPDLVTLFANGCCGNLNHVDVAWDDGQKGPAEAGRIGTILAAEVMMTWKKLTPLADGPLRVKSVMVELPLRPVDDAEVAAARDLAAKVKEATPPPFIEQVRAFCALDVAARQGRPWSVEVQVIALGNDMAWVSLPGEIFVELGLAIKAGSLFPHLHLAELANGSIGYIPNHKAYREGAYEVISARCANGSGESLVDAAVELLREIRRENSPFAK